MAITMSTIHVNRLLKFLLFGGSHIIMTYQNKGKYNKHEIEIISVHTAHYQKIGEWERLKMKFGEIKVPFRP